MARQSIMAKKAAAARNRKWDDDAIAFLQILHSGTRFFDYPHELVPEHHVVLLWDESIVNVQIRAADRGRGHPQDNVLRIFDPGIVTIQRQPGYSATIAPRQGGSADLSATIPLYFIDA